MLRELLGRIDSGGFATLDGIARDLGLGPREIAQMLAKLEELGFIEDAAAALRSACPDGCAGCAGCARSGACADESVKVWALTNKGRRVAKSDRGSGS
jgi:hypothetical protein